MDERLTVEEQRQLWHVAVKMHEQGWGIAFGFLFGLTLFLATIILVLKGGDHPGPHLSLLRIYFPGYSVTVVGSFIGFIYAFVVGYAIGRTIVTIYNRLISAGR
jgi:tetrahydromethanopterin S-methyltransferase subunit G